MIKKEFKTVDLSEIIPYGNNPRINEQAVDYVVESVKQVGNIDPIEIDEDGVILSGHTRLLALKKLRKKKTDVVVVSGLTAEQKTKYRILANKTAEVAQWDVDKLLQEIENIDFGEFDFNFVDRYAPEPWDDELLSEYDGHEYEFLLKRKVIIKYEQQERKALFEFLGINEDSKKVLYDVTELAEGCE